jgi:hypothetical protein
VIYMVDWQIHHKRTSYQYDPKQKKQVNLTFYIKSKQGKCREFEGDRIFVIGILNEDTKNYEEFACTEDEWFLALELMCKNDLRLKAQKRYINRLHQLATDLENKGAYNYANR